MYHFIVNPNSRSGQGRMVWKTVESQLKKEKIPYQVYFTKYRCHAAKIAGELTADGGEHTLVVLGGDGTVNEVVEGIRHLERTTIGYIPTGSSNDFARGLGLPANIDSALHAVLHSKHTKKIDIGTISYRNKKHRFAVSTGIGYDAAICHTVSVSKFKIFMNKLKLGRLAYVSVSLYCLYHCRPAAMSITVDGDKKLEFDKVYFTAGMNLPCEGGGCLFRPDALPDDGLLDIIIIADVPKYRALAILPAVFSGRHTHMKGVHIIRCRRADIESQVPLPVHTDGEPVFLQRCVTMALEDKHLKVITP